MVAAAQAVRGFTRQQVIPTAASDDEHCVAIGLVRREDQGPGAAAARARPSRTAPWARGFWRRSLPSNGPLDGGAFVRTARALFAAGTSWK